jgi:hypothetical protein
MQIAVRPLAQPPFPLEHLGRLAGLEPDAPPEIP